MRLGTVGAARGIGAPLIPVKRDDKVQMVAEGVVDEDVRARDGRIARMPLQLHALDHLGAQGAGVGSREPHALDPSGAGCRVKS